MEQQKQDYSKYILPAGIVVLGFVLYKKFFGTPPGDEKTLKAQADSVKQAQDDAAKQGTAAQTYPTIDFYTGLANDIYNEWFDGNSNFDYNVKWDVIKVNTLTDLQLLIQQFGIRAVNTSGWFSPCSLSFGKFGCQQYDLPSFLRATLKTATIAEINSYLSDSGINYQF